jgi:hypothetical protein
VIGAPSDDIIPGQLSSGSFTPTQGDFTRRASSTAPVITARNTENRRRTAESATPLERVRFLSFPGLARRRAGDLLSQWHERSRPVRSIPPIGAGRTLVAMSDYQSLVELAAKGMAERDNHPVPKSVTTPEAFYEIMASAALDAIGLQTLLEEFARAEQELRNADEGSNLAVNADTTTPPEDLSVIPQNELSEPPVTRMGYEGGVVAAPNRGERERGRAENARLRR